MRAAYWNDTPSSEKMLVDNMMFAGARVIHSCDLGKDGAYWIVMRDFRPTKRMRAHITTMLQLTLEAMPDDREINPAHQPWADEFGPLIENKGAGDG